MSTKRKRQQPQPHGHVLVLIEAADVRAVMLTDMIVGTFERAYVLAAQGMCVDAMLIDYDIQAAASDQHEAIHNCARTVIKAACSAVARGVPFEAAIVCLFEHVHTYVCQCLQQQTQAQ
jgi:hypothetical protein